MFYTPAEADPHLLLKYAAISNYISKSSQISSKSAVPKNIEYEFVKAGTGLDTQLFDYIDYINALHLLLRRSAGLRRRKDIIVPAEGARHVSTSFPEKEW